MLRVLDYRDLPPAYPVPWRVDRVYDTHPLVTNDSASVVDFVRVFIDNRRRVDGGRGAPETQHWGQMLPGETVELCLCDRDPADVVVTLGWFRPETGVEYVWRFVA